MSRILDGFRRFTGANIDENGTMLPESHVFSQESQPPPETWPPGFEHSARVQCHLRPEGRIVGCGQDHDLAAEKFRFLRHRLSQLRQHQPLSRLLVTSSVPKEGKTLVAVNLALSLVRSSSRVALIDADMRQSKAHRILGLDALPGLGEFLAGRLDLGATVRRVDPFGLYYLPAGHASSNPFELLQGQRMRELVALMAPAFDWIVFDSPPLFPFADAHCLATFVDSILLVTRQGVTPRESLVQGLACLNGAHVAGIVFNASNDARHDRYYYHYYPRLSRTNKQSHEAVSPAEEDTGR